MDCERCGKYIGSSPLDFLAKEGDSLPIGKVKFICEECGIKAKVPYMRGPM